MLKERQTKQALIAENASLRAQLEQANETLQAIRNGEVDALVVGEHVYMLESAGSASNRFRGEVLAQVNDVVIAVDNDRRVTYLNPAAERQYNVTASEVLGSDLDEVYHWRWLNDGDEAVATAALRNEGAWRGESIHIKHNGQKIYVESTLNRLHNLDGEIIGLLEVIRDITERKQAEFDAQFLAAMVALSNFINDAPELMWQAQSATAQYLGAARAGFKEVDSERDVLVFNPDYCLNVPSIAGVYPLALFGQTFAAEMRAGMPMAIADTQLDPRTAPQYASIYEPSELRAVLTMPLLRRGHWVASFWLGQPHPREWQDREITLVRTVAERMWLAVESARLQAQTQALNKTLEARVAERTAALHESQNQLRKLSARVERAREDERTRIAREVHDELGGSLTAVKMAVAVAARGHAADTNLITKLQSVNTQIDELVQAVRRIASDLRPSILDHFGLAAALKWQAEEWERNTGISCMLDIIDPDVKLNLERRTAMFRVFQESLTNIARHAEADQVNVLLYPDHDQVVLKISDNGHGISPEALLPGKSLGLLGMRERIREVAGDLDISGQPGQGTTVTIRVPLG